MFGLAAFFVLLSLFAAPVLAVPTVDLVFGWLDIFPILIVTVMAVYAWVFFPHMGWSMLEGDSTYARIRGAMATRWGGFFVIVPTWIIGILKFVGQVATVIIFTGYILADFEDASEVTIAITETWKTVVVVIILVAIRFDIFACELFYKMERYGFAAFVSFLAWVGWIGAIIFIIMEMIQLPDNIVQTWEVPLLVVAIYWFLISTFYTLMFLLGAIVSNSDDYSVLETNQKRNV